MFPAGAASRRASLRIRFEGNALRVDPNRGRKPCEVLLGLKPVWSRQFPAEAETNLGFREHPPAKWPDFDRRTRPAGRALLSGCSSGLEREIRRLTGGRR